MKKYIVGSLLTLALVVFVFAACGEGSPASGAGDTGNGDGPVRIAVAAPMTGDNAEYGLGFFNAATLQADIWNAAGGVLGREIVIEQLDDTNSSEEAAALAQWIVAQGDIVGVIGHFTSGVAMTAAPVYDANQIINISPSASHPDFSGIGEFIFRNNTVISAEAEAGLYIVANDLGLTQVGIVSIMTEWGDSTGDILEEIIATSFPTLNLVGRERVMEDALDLSPAITTLNAAGAEAVFSVSMYPTLGLLAMQFAPINPDIHLIGFSNAYSALLLELAGESANGIRFPVPFFADSPEPRIQEFVNAYIERNGYSPSALTAQAFDSVGWLLTAIEQAGTTYGPTVRDTLATIPYTGVAGSVYFTPEGDVDRDFYRVLIENGRFVQTYP